ncbi:DNA internalization-related competence protein ComEC/Rec2 [Aliikangiella coralliicola]|uniref:DNA internalization-related competence protein ComEC/Rec2 n=1 Tax=Aliikangiella coralliicola TaxID=2592383 RepID=A0A545U8U4_9GAMM|nr:DNA internalization-related competence protein ComEC/Rec2 [Aliikangiella coralliicola]TQV85833.1 DNA internalization-related competence protein ComEC/Rec2 [Aliikangiella coralliicola]
MSIKAFAFLSGMMSLLIITKSSQAIWALVIALIVYLLTYFSQAKQTLTRMFLAGLCWSCVNIIVWSCYSGTTVSEPVRANIDGHICSIPGFSHDSYRFDFCIHSIDQKRLSFGQRNRFKLTWGKYVTPPEIALKAGQRWRFAVKLRPPHGRVNPAGFDSEQWMLSEGYGGNGYIKSAILMEHELTLSSTYHYLRQKVFDYLSAHLADVPNKGLILAITMGERDQVKTDQWQLFKNTGTSHLLAISGLHIGIAALWSYWIILFLWRLSHRLCLTVSAQKAAQIGSLIGAFMLLLLSGLGLPAQRAFIMLFIFLISRWSGRNYRLASVLSIALLVILIIYPFALLSASFWLSFFAIFIISCVINREVSEGRRVTEWLKVNWYLYLALIPITLLFFNLLSPVSIIANLLLIPLTSFVLTPIAYVASLVSIVNSYLASQLFQFASLVIDLTRWLQTLLTSFDWTHFTLSLHYFSIFLLLLMVMILLVPRKLVSKAVLLPLGLLFSFSLLVSEKENSFEMIVFDIGQGLAIYVQTPEGNLLYDTGWGKQQYAIAGSVLLPFFEARGIKRLDKVVISHGDADHAGGLKVVQQSLQIDELIAGEVLVAAQSQNCHSYTDWRWGNVHFKFLSAELSGDALPDDSLPSNNLSDNQRLTRHSLSGNNSSCVLSIEVTQSNYDAPTESQTPLTKAGPVEKEKYKILLTGDIEKRVEKKLLAKGIGKYDVVIAPHHGSKTSSTSEFVERLNPRHVIFSTGYDNQWKFPRKSVVQRYLKQESQIWVTHQQGAITLKIAPETGAILSSERETQPHFWTSQY